MYNMKPDSKMKG